MSTDRDVTHIVRSWLEEGRTALPDRVLDAVLDQLPATPQRRPDRLAWRFDQMSSTTRLVGAVAAVVIVVVVGAALLFRVRDNVGGPNASPVATLAPSAASLRSFTTIHQDLAPGVYLIDQPFPARATFTVPAGWLAYAVDDRTAGILVNHAKPPNGSGWGLFLLGGPHVPSDPCHPDVGPISPWPATSADLVAALRRLPSVDAVASDVSIGGLPATLLTLTARGDLAGCTSHGATIWLNSDGTNYVMSPNEQVQVRVVDLGQPIMVLTTDYPQSSHWEDLYAAPDPRAHAADQAELRQILGSLVLAPATPGTAPSAAP